MRKKSNGYNKLVNYRNSEIANYGKKWRQIKSNAAFNGIFDFFFLIA